MKVYKYPIPNEERFSIKMPLGAKFLSLAWQDPSQFNPKGGPVMWYSIPGPHDANLSALDVDAEADSSYFEQEEEHFFYQAMTGFEIPKPKYGNDYDFRGTYQAGAGIVLHIFEEVWI